MITVTFQGERAGIIDDSAAPVHLLETTPELLTLWTTFQSKGVRVPTSGPRTKGMITDGSRRSFLLESFLTALLNVGYEVSR